MFYYFHQYLPDNVKQVHDIIGTCLATAAFAVKATIHQTLQTMPGALVFNWDIYLFFHPDPSRF